MRELENPTLNPTPGPSLKEGEEKFAMVNASHKYPSSHSQLANSLRKSAMVGEKKIWAMFQNLRLATGIRFRRQQPIEPYIADFYCAEFKCAVEIDGISHDTRLESDSVRDGYMNKNGIRVFRFTEKETRDNAEGVLCSILEILGIQIPPLTPPSRGGE